MDPLRGATRAILSHKEIQQWSIVLAGMHPTTRDGAPVI